MNPARRQLLDVLADGAVHSGESLGQDLGMSRAAVWKHVRALRELGIAVESRPGRGYRLGVRGVSLDADVIRRRLPGGCEAKVAVFDELDSTSSELGRRIGVESIHRQAVLAEYQSRGRGRRGRGWQSAHGQGLCLSLGWRFETGVGALAGVSLALGVEARNALASLGVDGVMLKWPNDLVYRDRKLGGILLELRGEVDGLAWLVAGIGINVHGGGDGDSRSDLSAFDLDRNRLAAQIIERWGRALAAYPDQGLAPWLAAYRRLDWLAGRPVKAWIDGVRVAGEARGVDGDGGLKLSCEGRERVLTGGEVTVRRGDAAA